MNNFPIFLVRGSLIMRNLNIKVDLSAFDASQRFLNMEESNGHRLIVFNNVINIAGIFGDIKNAITARFSNNQIVLTSTNYVLNVKPDCLTNFDFTTTEFIVRNN